MTRLYALLLGLAACTPDSGSATDDSAAADDSGPGVDDNADPDVHTYLPPDYAPSDPKRVIFLGDSITAGYGASDTSLQYSALLQQNDDATWPDEQGDDLATVFPGLTEVVDVSRAGATTDTELSQQIPKLDDKMTFPAEGQSLVVMTIGGNDITSLLMSGSADYTEPLQTIQDNLREIVTYFQDASRFPDGAYIYVTNVYDPSDGTGQADECFYGLDLSTLIDAMEQTNTDSEAMAEELGFSWVDLHGHFLGHGYNGDDEQNPYYMGDDYELWFYSDCIHPDDAGHNQIRRLFMAAIQDQALQLEASAD